MAQIGPKTIFQTYLEHPGLNQSEQGHKKYQNKVICQQPQRTSQPIANRSTTSKKLVELVEPVSHLVYWLIKILKF